jgi:HSP20 family molecular chaperone IbpA
MSMSSRDPTRSMWAESLALLEQVETMRRQCFELRRHGPGGPSWEPPVDVYEAGRELMLVVALPGVPPDAVRVVIDGGVISVQGHRPIPAPMSAAVHRLEIPYGRFERRIELQPGMYEIVRRDLTDGCLFLTLKRHG